MNAYLSDQPVHLSPLRDEQGNQPRFGLLLEPGAALARETLLWAGLFDSYDQKEGMRAFLEKRKPVFEDR